MGFVIQWLVYLAAFVAGSAVAYGIATLLIKADKSDRVPEHVAPEPVPQPDWAENEVPQPVSPAPDVASAEESETFEQLLWSESAEPAVQGAQAAEAAPELAEPPAPETVEPEDAESQEPETQPELTQPQWPGPPSQWPGIGVKR